MSLSNGTLSSVTSLERGPRALLRCSLPHAGLALLGGLALGCSSDGIDLGGGLVAQDLRRGTRCMESTTVEDDVLVTHQDELAALEGCEEILGNLEIQLFADADLSPLHALRVVDAALTLGTSEVDRLQISDFETTPEQVQAILDAEEPLHGTWLRSLTGLESLERAGELQVFNTGIANFEPLARLERLTTGRLLISSNAELVTLAGLGNVSDLTSVDLPSNPALQSLDGLELGEALEVVSLTQSPQLTNIDALSSLTRVSFLNLDGIGVTDLDALSGLTEAFQSIYVLNNPALADASGLGNVVDCVSVLYENNGVLKALPSFQSYGILPELITVVNNPELESLELDAPFALPSSFGPDLGGQSRALGTKTIVITDNAKLRSITFGPSESGVLGFIAVQVVGVERNPSLTRIDFGGFERADVLVINDNVALDDVTIGNLATVDTLELTGNPALDTSVFDAVRTFQRIESDQPSAPSL